jgi:histidine triad (HIT) family protein
MAAMEEDCLVCSKHRGEILTPGRAIFADDLVYAGHALIPEGQQDTFLGTLFVEPKRHVPELADLTAAEACAIGVLVARLSRALMRSGDVEHIYLFVFGHHVPHLHIWLLPRYAGTPREYWGTRADEWPDAPRGGINEITALCDRLRETLQDAE